MTVRPVVLDGSDAVELGEPLQFLASWLDRDADPLANSLRRFAGGVGELVFGSDER